MPCYIKTDLSKRNSSAHRKDAKDALHNVPLQSLLLDNFLLDKISYNQNIRWLLI